MNIAEMHVWFRQYAQQMGMQNVRAILPEQIDLLINTSITDIVNQVIKQHIGLTNDRVITDNSKLGQINILRTLYKVALLDMSPKRPTTKETRTFVFNSSDRLNGRMTTNFNKVNAESLIPDCLFFVDFSLNYKQVKNNLGYSGYNNSDTFDYSKLLKDNPGITIEPYKGSDEFILKGTYEVQYASNSHNVVDPIIRLIKDSYGYWFAGINKPNTDSDFNPSVSTRLCTTPGPTRNFIFTDTYTFEVSNACAYSEDMIIPDAKETYAEPTFDDNSLETNFYPVRLIDDIYLADTLNDFILKNRLRSPIIVNYNNDTFDIYIDKFNKVVTPSGDIRYVLENNLIPYMLRMSYISKPATVKYSEDLGGKNVDCDLPEFMHVDILKHAVDLYRIAVSGALHGTSQAQGENAQQQQEVQQ